MSFELIDDQDEHYPPEHFTRDSVIKHNITAIVDKIRTVIITAKNLLTTLEARVDVLESTITSLKSRINVLENP